MVRVENAASKIYVGNLGDYGDKAELERAFSKYGEVVSVWERVTITFLLKMEQIFSSVFFSNIATRLVGCPAPNWICLC